MNTRYKVKGRALVLEKLVHKEKWRSFPLLCAAMTAISIASIQPFDASNVCSPQDTKIKLGHCKGDESPDDKLGGPEPRQSDTQTQKG